jgi:serine phosphatase RsbU (regulator of sigma subunit)
MKILVHLIILIILANYNFLTAQSFLLNSDSLKQKKVIYPTAEMDFKPGDNVEWAKRVTGEKDWKIEDSQILPGSEISWDGVGWFRLFLDVDSNLVGKNVGIYLYSTGDLQFYLNGNLIFNFDEMVRLPQTIVFDKPGENYVAIRFENPDWQRLHNANSWAGFRIVFADYDYALESKIKNDRTTLIEELVFLIPALLLALLHSFIFIFDRRKKQNFYYVLFLLSFSVYIFILYYFRYSSDQLTVSFLNRFFLLLLNYILFFGALTIFKICSFKQKYIIWFFVTATLIGILGFIFPGKISLYYLTYIFIIYISYRAGAALTGKENIHDNVKIIRVGFIFLSLSGIYQILLSFGIIGPLFGTNNVFLFGVLIFLLSMSVGLAKEFVDNQNDLEKQLSQVKKLSAKTLKQELVAKELETEKKYLEIENERKSIELSDARNLQLSMLPKDIPKFDNLEISAYMNTATEVGGDYYDIIPLTSNSLIVALGDATGHGTKAGLMVAIMKSMFKSLASNYLITDFFSKCNEIIKDMKLGNLFMSLSVIRINDNYIVASSAGMPPILIFRSSTRNIETLLFKSMPLGAFKNFPYEEKETEVRPGDIIFIFSDGLSELFNKDKEMFGIENIKKLLVELESEPTDKIIGGFKQKINNWLNEKSLDDDVTMIVIKIK